VFLKECQSKDEIR
jgi:hypothetical protein